VNQTTTERSYQVKSAPIKTVFTMACCGAKINFDKQFIKDGKIFCPKCAETYKMHASTKREIKKIDNSLSEKTKCVYCSRWIAKEKLVKHTKTVHKIDRPEGMVGPS